MIAFVALAALPAACSYAALDFFFDGVPDPNATVARASGAAGPEGLPGTPAEPMTFAHEPVRQGRCGACHVVGEPRTKKTDAGGLCDECHEPLTRDLAYVHGPVAARACLHCHDPHASPHAGILRKAADEVCSGCHAREDLGPTPGHEAGGLSACISCHGPHGGSDRFFLTKRDR